MAEVPMRLVDDAAHFDFLGVQDTPWLRILMDEMVRCDGMTRRRLAEHLAEPLPCAAPHFKRRAASRLLLRLWQRERCNGIRPATIRDVMFQVAAQSNAERGDIVRETAAVFGTTGEQLERALFADLPGEGILHAPAELPDIAQIVLRTNLAMAQSVLMRAASIQLHIEGNVRPIVRLAKLRRLLCTVRQTPAGLSPVLEISGPYALFKHTLVYGRALAELLPHLVWCRRFALDAKCKLFGRVFDVRLDNHAPIFSSSPPRPFDSKLEARFAADLSAIATDWDVIREPEPIPAGGTLIFPDFMLRHRLLPDRRVFIEIAGYWTPAYLAEKFARLRQAGLANLIVCVDASRAAAANAHIGTDLTVIPYRRRVDVQAVMRQVHRMLEPATT